MARPTRSVPCPSISAVAVAGPDRQLRTYDSDLGRTAQDKRGGVVEIALVVAKSGQSSTSLAVGRQAKLPAPLQADSTVPSLTNIDLGKVCMIPSHRLFHRGGPRVRCPVIIGPFCVHFCAENDSVILG